MPRVVPACRIGQRPPTVVGIVDHRRAGQVDGESAVGQDQAKIEVVDPERLAEDALDVLGDGAAGAEIVEECGHPLQGVEAGAVEATVDRILEPMAEPDRTSRPPRAWPRPWPTPSRGPTTAPSTTTVTA